MKNFTIHHTSRDSRARTGTLSTPHGPISTPNFMPVATRGMLHGMELADAIACDVQVMICNTHHLNKSFGVEKIKEAGGLHAWMKWDRPLATDSGGFQVFSLGSGMTHGVGKQAGGINARPHQTKELTIAQAVVDPGGVIFSDGEQLVRLTPEVSIQWQEAYGADIIFAFDECTSPLHDEAYNYQAMLRTHQWAQQCLDARTRNDQMMFGVVQGGSFAKLRVESAKVIGNMPFEGFGIGGSFGQHELVETLRLVMPILPVEKPVHALGIGWLQDILLSVDQGVDLFDCVEPIRRARHRHALTATHYVDVRQIARQNPDGPLVAGCDCLACTTTTAEEIRKLCAAKDFAGSRWLSIHNVRMMMNVMKDIREAIATGRWASFRDERLQMIEAIRPTVIS
jgi:tRNA-guanine family transglycosylase